jgi:hypothetical protein
MSQTHRFFETNSMRYMRNAKRLQKLDMNLPKMMNE